MDAENMTRFFARSWEDEDSQLFTSQEHEYERNATVFVAVAILVLAVTRFTTYCVDRLLLLNFPSLSTEWCFTSATEKDTKLQRAQDSLINFAAALALFCRWPIGLFFPVHLWETVTWIGSALAILELTFVILLGSMVGFIRVAHRTAQITGWEYPDSPARAFSPGDYSKEHRQLVSPAIVGHVSEPGWTVNKNSSAAGSGKASGSSSSSCSITINGTDTTINGKKGKTIKNCDGFSIEVNGKHITINNNSSSNLTDTTDSSFMGFSPVALGTSTWLKTRQFANSVFSNSTQSTSSCDSFGKPSVGRGSGLKFVENVAGEDKGAEGLDLLTGTPRA